MPKQKNKQKVSPQTFDHAAMIDDPDRWPCWPFLPVKRGDHSLENKNLGVLLGTQEHADGKRIIYHGYMFDWPKTPEAVKALPKTEYPNTAAMLADGWVVD